MDALRRNQIAGAILTRQLREKREQHPVLAQNFVKVVAGEAVDAGITAEEADEFARDVERELGR